MVVLVVPRLGREQCRGEVVISRRTMLVGLLASVTMPRLPIPTRGISYIVFEDIPLERFGNSILWPADVYRDMAASYNRVVGHAMHDAAKDEIVHVRLGQ